MKFRAFSSFIFSNIFVITELLFQILEELLKKLEVEHIVWCNDKNGFYYQVS
jgi:hypothetical protein